MHIWLYVYCMHTYIYIYTYITCLTCPPTITTCIHTYIHTCTNTFTQINLHYFIYFYSYAYEQTWCARQSSSLFRSSASPSQSAHVVSNQVTLYVCAGNSLVYALKHACMCMHAFTYAYLPMVIYRSKALAAYCVVTVNFFAVAWM